MRGIHRIIFGILPLLLLAACGPSVDDSYSSDGSSSGNNSSGGTQTGLGYTWETGTSGTTAGFRSVAYGNSRWVAVGTGAGIGVIGASSDGKTWTLTQENSTTYYYLHNVAFGNNTFVALSESGILTSTDGIAWSAANVPTSNGVTPYPQNLVAAAYGNGLWVAVDDFFLTENGLGIWTSTDGLSWNILLLNTPYAQPTAMTYGNGTFVIVGYGGLLLTSPDGANWTNRSFTTGQAMMGVTYANGEFVAVTNDGEILTATDATGQWTSNAASVNGFNAIGYGGGVFLAVGSVSGAMVYVSTDAQTWTNATSYLPNAIASSPLNGIAYGNGTFVAVGDSGAVAVSHQ
ncbi:MAG TPA: hypothetical protein VFM15_00775 [Gammaproteobacteria bacterium]|nr:hypothetical protein [Gammaproteobacteria bacterium]